MDRRLIKLPILVLSCGLILTTAILLYQRLAHRSNVIAAHYDVIVVGAGPGGIAASIQAARMGVHVALLEPTDWIGGQMSAAGVGNMDEGSVSARRSGLYKEFASRAQVYYANKGKSVDTCYYETDSLCVDPAAAQAILKSMLASESRTLRVYTNTSVDQVLKSGGTIVGVVANGQRLSSDVVIDGDEYGDILAQAGAAYRLGTGTSADLKKSSCVQSITHTAVIKYYPNGMPASLRFTSPPPGYSTQLASYFATYLKQDGIDHFRSRSERGLSFASYAAFRGLPDLINSTNYDVLQQNGRTITRTSLNLGNDFPRVGNLSTQYVSDDQYRRQVNCQAKLLTLQLVYYIQHDMGETHWSLADDEGYDTAYNRAQHCANMAGYEAFEEQMPVEPYVREGRRLISEDTLTGNDLAKAEQSPAQPIHYASSIAVGYYPMDLHACHAPLEASFDLPSDLHRAFTSGAFEVPLGAIIPEKTDGLLAVEKNISASREANGAIREQPIAMDIGQAAGVLAALSVMNHQQPRQIPYQDVQHALESAGAVTSLSH